MVQVIKQTGLGSLLGESFGGGVNQALQLLAQQKLQDMLQQKQAAQFKAGGLPEVLAFMDPQVQASYLRDFAAAQQSAQGQQQESQLNDILAQLTLSPQKASLSVLDKEVTPREAYAAVHSPEDVKQFYDEPKAEAPGAVLQQESIKLNNFLQREDLSPTMKNALRSKFAMRSDKLEKQQEKVDKATEKYYTEILENAEVAASGNERLNEMERIIEEGKLSNPLTASTVGALEKTLGVDLSWMLKEGSQRFKKVQAEFLKDLKKIFGARITDTDIREFMKSIPNLGQSDKAKMAVIRRLKDLNEARSLKSDIMKKIIEENGGYRPANLRSLVQERYKKALDQKAKEFNAGIKDSIKMFEKLSDK